MDLSPIGNLCEVISSIPKSVATAIWFYIQALWPTYFIAIILALVTWVFIEIKGRYGNWHYPTKNGFSPVFNSFLGVITFSFFQGLMYALINLITWGTGYCIPWLNGLYLLPFVLTGLFLVKTGIWVELRSPFRRKKKYGVFKRTNRRV
jgi:hypothetical protein